MHYKTKGEGENLLVLLHPFPVNSNYFNRMLDYLELTNWKVILPDFPGFGKSPPHTEQSLNLDLIAKRVYSLIEDMEYESLVIGGVSMGGYVTMAFERLYPELSSAIILSNTSDKADADGGKNREVLAKQILAGGRDEFLDNLMKRLLGKTTFETRRELINEVEEMMVTTSAESLAGAMRGMGKREESRTLLASIEKPILIIAGNEDEITGDHLAIEMQSMYKNAILQIVPHTGHFSAMEEPKKYANMILNFLNE